MENAPIFEMTEAQIELKVYSDRVTLHPKGIAGFLTKGLQGKKEIPFSSITSVQFKEAGMTTGYIQFGVAGGIENTGGALGAVYDENSFAFGGLFGDNAPRNKLANEIVEYIRANIGAKVSSNSSTTSLADELQKLQLLKEHGVLSNDEFAAAKAKLISQL